MQKEIRVKIESDLCWTYGISIEQIKKDIERLEKLGVDEIYIETEDYYGSPSISCNAYQTRLETKEEYETRLLKEKQEYEERKARDLATLEKLKNLYPDKN